jgi:hypothetical protein
VFSHLRNLTHICELELPKFIALSRNRPIFVPLHMKEEAKEQLIRV